ncbi:MAG TPA: hypothetical protein P5048_03390 [Chlamydiales bacterium]|nr:hypothetical protein [Chlamydiales bacterium]
MTLSIDSTQSYRTHFFSNRNYIPFFSTANSIQIISKDIFHKIQELYAKILKKELPPLSQNIILKDKQITARIILVLVPIIGNLILLYYDYKHYFNDSEFILDHINEYPKTSLKLSRSLKYDHEFIFKAVDRNIKFWDQLPKAIKKNPFFILKFIQKHPQLAIETNTMEIIFKNFSSKQKRKFFQFIFKQPGMLPAAILRSYEFMQYSIKHYPESLTYFSKSMITFNLEICEIFKENPEYFRYLPQKAKDESLFLKRACQINEKVLLYCNPWIFKDENIDWVEILALNEKCYEYLTDELKECPRIREIADRAILEAETKEIIYPPYPG